MKAINPETRTSVHFSINYVLAMGSEPGKAKTVDFQKALLDNGLDFSQTNIRGNTFTLLRSQPSNLTVKIEAPVQHVSSVHVIAQNPSYDSEMFLQEASAVMDAYQKSWPAEQYQVIRAMAKIHHLYSSEGHAFKYLWEDRLGQSPQDLVCLGKRPVAGGGLRLIMPPHAVENEQLHSIEIRIESFLHEPRKVLIETIFVWPKPTVLGKDERFDPGLLLGPVEEYASNEVWTFLTQKKNR